MFHVFFVLLFVLLIDMSKLEKAIVAIVEVFEEYAGTDEQKTQLSNAELGQLIKAQITSPEFKVRISEMHKKGEVVRKKAIGWRKLTPPTCCNKSMS